MALFAAKAGKTVIDENLINSLFSLQEFYLIYDGTQIDAVTGAGITEYEVDDYSFAIRFRLNNTNEIGRVEFDLRRVGDGADLVVAVYQDFDPSGQEGTLLIERLMPREFLPDTRAWVSVPIGLDGLLPDAYYWLVVRQAGDQNNHVRLYGENNQDAVHPVYRRVGTSGPWTPENAIHFRVFAGAVGDIRHGIYGFTGLTWVEYEGETIARIRRYLPTADDTTGIRETLTLEMDGDLIKRGRCECLG